MAKLYLIAGAAMPTTSATATITTGTSIKTLIQLKAASGLMFKVVEWGVSFDGFSAAAPIKCELIETDVAATVTAYVAADLMKFDDPNAPATNLQIGSTSNSGYNSSVEGSITAVRVFDAQLVAPSVGYFKQFPLGREPVVNVSKFLRIRVTSGTSVNAYPYIIIEE